MRTLVVIAPSYRGRTESWTSLVERLKREDEFADADWMLWTYRAWRWGRTPTRDLARSLGAAIHEKWVQADAEGRPYERVLLFGHSLGGLLIRQAYLFATGAEGEALKRPWAECVTRIVLFAALNRGVDWTANARYRAFNWCVQMIPFVRRSVLRDLMRGSHFLTNLRIVWIRHFAELGDDAPCVVQLRGTEDWWVHADDSHDIEQFRRAYFGEVAGAGHADLHRLDAAPDPDARYAVLRDAIVNPVPQYAADRQVEGAKRIVFLTHGIRAENDGWPERAGDIIQSLAPDVEVRRPTRGYISALRFALPPTRRRYAQYFQDEYAEALARNPTAEFHFVGHSNGTYLLGRCLEELPGMRFERVVLAGSVLPRSYDWPTRIARGQVRAVWNERAAADFPVGVLCSALNGLRMRDVGPGGFHGFFQGAPAVEEHFYYSGGHGAMLKEADLERYARFVLGLHGADGDREEMPLAPAPTKVLAGLSKWARELLVVVVVLLGTVLGGFVLWEPLWGPLVGLWAALELQEVRAAVAVAVLLLILLVLDRL